MLLEEAVAVLVAERAEVDDPSVAGVGDDHVGPGDGGRDDTSGKQELVLAATPATERLEACLLAHTAEDLQAVTVAFRHDDVA